jgi:hypothetical protein
MILGGAGGRRRVCCAVMMHTRRQFIRTVPAFGAFAIGPGRRDADARFERQQGAGPTDPEWPAPLAPGAPVDESFPSHHPSLAREMVAVSHGNLARVRELLARHAELAKASWDWGYGDWETALGAASHVGNRAIAELLLEHGAPPTHFSAAMLGQVDVLKAFLGVTPGLQRMRGPHGLTLMLHARKGGPQAAAVVALLETVGGADMPYRDDPLTAEERASLEGRYLFGDRPRDRFVVSLQQNALMMARVGAPARGLYHQGGFRFHAAGAEGVSIRFERDGTKTAAVTIANPDPVVRAVKQT